MPDDTQLTALCAAVDVDDDTPVRVETRGTAFAVFRVGGRHYVTQDACTHGPGSLAEGLSTARRSNARSIRDVFIFPPAAPVRRRSRFLCASGRRVCWAVISAST
jgi:hypothetical protein